MFLGPLHSEILCEKMLGDWMRDSGCVAMLIDADVTSPGRAEALVKGSHITWTLYANHVQDAARGPGPARDPILSGPRDVPKL